MLMNIVKSGAISTATFGTVGGLIFGSDVASYVSSSARSVKTAVTDAVPMEFQLRRRVICWMTSFPKCTRISAGRAAGSRNRCAAG